MHSGTHKMPKGCGALGQVPKCISLAQRPELLDSIFPIFILSNEMCSVLLSTYLVTPGAVSVQVQLVNVDTHAIVGTTLYQLPNGPRTRAPLKNQDSVATSQHR